MTDGAPAGTVPVFDPRLYGDIPEVPGSMARVGDRIYLSAELPGEKPTLWSADGTAAGTTQHLAPGHANLWGHSLRYFGGSDAVLFVGSSDPTGSELWVLPADGSSPFPLEEVYPGPGTANAAHPNEVSGRVVFRAFEPELGDELDAIDPIALGVSGAEPIGVGCSAGSFARLGHAGSPAVGASFDVTLEGAPPNAGAQAWFSPVLGAIPLGGGCTAYLAAPHFLGATTTDATGEGAVGAALSAEPAIVGLELTLQYLVTEPGGPLLGAFGLSDGLEIVIGE